MLCPYACVGPSGMKGQFQRPSVQMFLLKASVGGRFSDLGKPYIAGPVLFPCTQSESSAKISVKCFMILAVAPQMLCPCQR